MITTITVEFKYSEKEPELLKLQAERMLNTLKEWFPDYTVAYDKPVAASGGDNLEISFESATAKGKGDDKKSSEKTLVSKILISGTVAADIPVEGAGKEAAAKTPATPDATPAATAQGAVP
jgi:hypothetical protein